MPPKKKQIKHISLPVNEPTINSIPEPIIQNTNTLDKFFQLDNQYVNINNGFDTLNNEYLIGNTFNNESFNNESLNNESLIGNTLNYNTLNNNTNNNQVIPFPEHNISNTYNHNINYKKTENISYSLSEIKKKLELLTEDQLIEIFRIIKNNNEKYSVNKNGIFINISNVKRATIKDINNFIYFSENNNKIFDEEENSRNIYRDIISS
jgi:hypothetical protein